MARSEPQLNFRCPPELRAQLEAAAFDSQRSLTQEIVRRLHGSFGAMSEREDMEEREAVSIGLTDPSDRAAVMKVLLLSEVMLLRRRVDDLGGKDTVLSMAKHEVAERVDGTGLLGTREERTTHFSKVLESWPLTALLTSDEIRKIADRVVAVQSAAPATTQGRPVSAAVSVGEGRNRTTASPKVKK